MENIKERIQKNKSIVEIVTAYIRKSIIEEKIKIDKRISMREIAEELDISRTPVREAIRKLESEGLIELLPRKGFIVKSYKPNEVKEIYEAREILELFLVKRSCDFMDTNTIQKLKEINNKLSLEFKKDNRDILKIKKLNEDFHFLIYRVSKNNIICEIVNNLWQKTSGLFIKLFSNPEQGINTFNEHEAILDALARKDRKNAEIFLKKHLVLNEHILTK